MRQKIQAAAVYKLCPDTEHGSAGKRGAPRGAAFACGITQYSTTSGESLHSPLPLLLTAADFQTNIKIT